MNYHSMFSNYSSNFHVQVCDINLGPATTPVSRISPFIVGDSGKIRERTSTVLMVLLLMLWLWLLVVVVVLALLGYSRDSLGTGMP